ncbi:DVU_1551 family NTP transferase [Desulfopila sp. IMCC35008]|uniref:DVU_1551 family NTP transferase n=1 Tax=Desulfopila sp. IMCC35008 TaxID=2653858 RepID=UPI0013D85E37|nr:NTP transferase domain-containing protein [Desulfopila sp. IMCC35008]
MRTGVIILAAGYSSRMVEFKPLLQIAGRTVVRRCVDLFKNSTPEQTIVVTGHLAHEVEAALGTSAVSVFNPNFDSGMYSSICRGVKNLHRDLDGFFLLPVDIPLIRPATIDILHTSFDGSAVLYPRFNDRRGHPPLIPAHHIPAILAYNGDGGLKKLLRSFPSRDIPVWDRTVLMDMDTEEDYTVLRQFHTSMSIGSREEVAILARTTLPAKGLAHGKAVAEIALKLGEALSANDLQLNPDLLHNAGLLHDIGKGQPNHEQAGGEIVGRLGLTGLVPCIGNHQDCISLAGKLSEAELIWLADKLVQGTCPLTVKQHFERVSGNSIDTILGR